jgi:hypothetical protein
MIGLDDAIFCTKFLNVKDTFTYGPHIKQGLHEIATSRLLEKFLCESKVNEYHLIFDLNGVLVTIGEGPTRSRPVILQPKLKEFLSSYATKFIMYIWFSTMKKKHSRHLETIRERIGVHLES